MEARLAAAQADRDQAQAACQQAAAGVEAAERELAGAQAGDGRDESNRSLQERLADAQNAQVTPLDQPDDLLTLSMLTSSACVLQMAHSASDVIAKVQTTLSGAVHSQSLQSAAAADHGTHAAFMHKHILRHPLSCDWFWTGLAFEPIGLQTSAEADAKQADMRSKHLRKQLAEQQKGLQSMQKEAAKLQRDLVKEEAAVQACESR